MRDLVLLGVLPLFIIFILKRPFIGLGLWIWTAMFFPNAWVYGIASGIRYNLIFSALTILSYLMSKDRKGLRINLIVLLVSVFFIWTTITTFFTIGSPEIAWEIWSRFLKVWILFLFVNIIIRKRIHIDFFLFCLALSIGFFGALEGLKFIVSGGAHRIDGFQGHVLGDRNELALSFVMMLPILHYLRMTHGISHKLLNYALLITTVLLVIAVIGTLSRGGLIALAAVSIYYVYKSDKKVHSLFYLFALIGVGFLFAPNEWYSRMDTIAEANQDASFMGRVVAWKLSFIMAVENPLLGGGFKSLEYFPVWSDLSRNFDSYPFFYTGDAVPDPHQGRAAHSIYFQVLGEQGPIGFILFISIILLTLNKAKAIYKVSLQPEDQWIRLLVQAISLSVFAYCVGGAALSFAYFEMLYALSGLIAVLSSHFRMFSKNYDENKLKDGLLAK